MDDHHQQFENFLHEFEPRRPRGLPGEKQGAPSDRVRRAAAGTITVLTLAASIWLALTQPAPRTADIQTQKPVTREAPSLPVSSLSLTRLAATDPIQFNVALDAAARTSLPDFRRPDSSLRGLAKE
jgi:hypothetical protein